MPSRPKRIALVTGANKGIGFEVARQLARKGFQVFLGARNAKAGKEAAETLRAEKAGDVSFIEIDVADEDSIHAAADELSNRIDHLDALINNAGIVLENDENILQI